MTSTNPWRQPAASSDSSTDDRRRREIRLGIIAATTMSLILGVGTLFNRVLISNPVPNESTSSSRSSRSPFSLMGMTKLQVQEQLGPPSVDQDGIWHYDTPKGTLVIEFRDDTAIKIRPLVFDLTAVTPAQSPSLNP